MLYYYMLYYYMLYYYMLYLYYIYIVVLKAEGLTKRSFFCKILKIIELNSINFIYVFIIDITIHLLPSIYICHYLLTAMPDPFAVITVDGEQTHSTLSDKSTLNPFWNTMCRFLVFEKSVISIQVFDQKKFKKDGQGFLGVATFLVSSAIDLRISQSSKNNDHIFLENNISFIY